MDKVKDEMKSLLCDLGAFRKQPCSDEENKQFDMLKKQKQQLPDGVYEYKDSPFGYYTLLKEDLTDDEISRLIMLKQTKYLRSIRNSMIFFVTLSIIVIILLLFNMR